MFYFFYNQVLEILEDIAPFAAITTDLSSRQIIFNDINDNPHVVSNLIFLLAKMFVCRKRCENESSNIHQFKTEIYNFRNMERYIATKNGNMKTFMKKWYNINIEPSRTEPKCDSYIYDYIDRIEM